MIKIGLTGGMGSGKSTVAKLFADLGVPIIDADVIAHELTAPHTTASQAIIKHFGPAILNANNAINRQALSNIIFQNKSEREWLEQLLHPLILKEMLRQIIKLKTTYCILVIPLLTETKKIHFLDRVLVIDAPEALQIARITARNDYSLEQIQAILQSQSTREDRLKIADDVIQNDQSLTALATAVSSLHKKYLALGLHTN